MKLTESERLILINQYNILLQLKPSKEEKRSYELSRDVLQNGYEFLYHDVSCALLPPVAEHVSKKVYEVFEMFRVVDASYKALTPEEKQRIDVDDLSFAGFDGNNETEYMGFARFLCERKGLYEEQLSSDFNSHRPMLDQYNRMLAVYKPLVQQLELMGKLSAAQLDEIASVTRVRR